MTWTGLVGVIVSVGACALFLVSTAKKLSMPKSVVRMAQNVGVPNRIAGILAVTLVLTEFTAGVSAVWPAAHVVAGVLTASLGTSSAAAALVALRTRRVVLCACFGTSQRPLGLVHILRVPLFWAAGTVQIFIPPAWPDRFTIDVCAGIAAVMCATQSALAGRVVLAGAADRRALSEGTNSSVAV